jgi:hypothetical protein
VAYDERNVIIDGRQWAFDALDPFTAEAIGVRGAVRWLRENRERVGSGSGCWYWTAEYWYWYRRFKTQTYMIFPPDNLRRW